MKKILTIISIATLFAACQTQDKGSLEIKKESIPLDTTGLYRGNANGDTAKITQQSVTTQQKTVQTTTTQQPAPPQVIYKTRTIIHENTRYLPAPQVNTASHTTSTVTAPAPVVTPPSTQTSGTTSTNTSGNYPTTGNGNNGNNGVGTGTNAPNNGGIVPAHTKPDRNNGGWSDAAKDATIGGVGGAVGGAILSRNKGKGALLGGIIGAAGGYIIGRKKDKANNRDSIYK